MMGSFSIFRASFFLALTSDMFVIQIHEVDITRVIDLGPFDLQYMMTECFYYMTKLVALTFHLLSLNGTQTLIEVHATHW